MRKKKKRPARKRPVRKLTLEEVVTAAVNAGATVSVGLVPIGSGVAPIQSMVKPGVDKAVEWINSLEKPERPKLNLTSAQWPGSPGTRDIMAAMEYTDRDVDRVFKDNPSSQWIITPFEIIERTKFYAPKPKALPVPEQSTSNPS